MLASILTVTVLLPFSLGFSENSLEFSVKYFRERNAPFVCLVACDNNKLWNTKFVKAASDQSIAVSILDTTSWWQDDIHQCMLQRFTNIGVLMDADCQNTEYVFLTASQQMWFDSTYIWLIIDENMKLESENNITIFNSSDKSEVKILRELEHMNISVDADIVMGILSGSSVFNLFDIFNFGRIQGGDLNVVDIGVWSKENGLAANLNGYKYYRRWDFGQWKMRLISVITSPLEEFEPEMLTSLRHLPGVSVITRTTTIILMVVAEIHNFKFVHKVTDRWLGSYEKNSTRVVTNSLYFREQDVTTVLRFLTVLSDKLTIIHPSLTSLETRYFYRIPTTGPGKYENQFLRPLSDGVWWSLVAVSALGMILLALAAALERRPSSVQFAIFSVAASVSQQFFEDEFVTRTTSPTRKLTIFVTGICCVLVYNYYTSSVVSWLLNGPPPSINSLRELLEGPLDIILEDVGYTRSWLNDKNYYFYKRRAADEDAIRRKILGKKNKPIFKPVDEGIAMVKAGGYAYHTETDIANRLISRTFTKSELCEVGSLNSMEKTLLYPGLQKNSPYKEFLSWSLIRLLERGIVSCIQYRTLSPPISCKASMPRALALGSAAPAFILLTFGFVLATAIMFVERFTFKRTPQKPKLEALFAQQQTQNPIYIIKHGKLRRTRYTNGWSYH